MPLDWMFLLSSVMSITRFPGGLASHRGALIGAPSFYLDENFTTHKLLKPPDEAFVTSTSSEIRRLTYARHNSSTNAPRPQASPTVKSAESGACDAESPAIKASAANCRTEDPAISMLFFAGTESLPDALHYQANVFAMSMLQ